LETVRAELKETQLALSNAGKQAEANDQEHVASLESSLLEMTKKYEDAKAEMEELKTTVAKKAAHTQNSAVEKKDEEIAVVKSQVDALEGVKSLLQKELETMKTVTENAKVELASSNEELTQARDDLRDAQDEIETCRSRIQEVCIISISGFIASYTHFWELTSFFSMFLINFSWKKRSKLLPKSEAYSRKKRWMLLL
jgi:chromosome segregation ATPase